MLNKEFFSFNNFKSCPIFWLKFYKLLKRLQQNLYQSANIFAEAETTTEIANNF